ncbi:MAG: LLM class flavin-dependent oxidoreductase [Microlunatus sp.]|nr:LLM class flavin-dependent oxidoreductase [Microlunatus sp.]
MTRLSVLDLVPVRTGQSTADAVTASVQLARTADELGYTRYWVAEHHNMPAVAATNPPVLIAILASATGRIRIGSGGVMLPNHAPLVVAEQFALLEATYPGRIDLGIGRAPGSDRVTSHVLRGGHARLRHDGRDDQVESFAEDLSTLTLMMQPEGVHLSLAGHTYGLTATPAARTTPQLWLLGSSMYSADLAASQGLPYVFAHHFGGGQTLAALERYRSRYQPSTLSPEPVTIAVVNAAVATTQAEAERLTLPQRRSMWRLRTGQPLTAQDNVEEAESASWSAADRAAAEDLARGWFVGTPSSVAGGITALAEQFGTDEVMISPIAGAYRDTPLDAAPARVETLRLLAEELL